MTGTVSQFRSMVFERIGVAPESYQEFIGCNPARIRFWEELNRFGGRRIKELPPEVVANIDETVRLSSAEWAELKTKLEALL
jgi:hypothetical protein